MTKPIGQLNLIGRSYIDPNEGTTRTFRDVNELMATLQRNNALNSPMGRELAIIKAASDKTGIPFQTLYEYRTATSGPMAGRNAALFQGQDTSAFSNALGGLASLGPSSGGGLFNTLSRAAGSAIGSASENLIDPVAQTAKENPALFFGAPFAVAALSGAGPLGLGGSSGTAGGTAGATAGKAASAATPVSTSGQALGGKAVLGAKVGAPAAAGAGAAGGGAAAGTFAGLTAAELGITAGSAILGYLGADRAADTLAGSANQAQAQIRQDLAPYVNAGAGILNPLYDFVAAGPETDLERAEGFRQIQNSAAAAGKLRSGNTLKELVEFNNMLNQRNRTQRFSELFNLATLGSNAASQQATQTANLTTDAGSARASGQIGGLNALNNFLNNFVFLRNANAT